MLGIFDSGSGGLTVLRKILDTTKCGNIVYFGDIRNAPYANKSREELSVFTANSVRLLLKYNTNTIISACNSLSASLATSLSDVFDHKNIKLFEMVGPTVRYFKNSDSKILVLATLATAKSGIYQNAFKMIGKNVSVHPMIKLSELIEFGASTDDIKENTKESLRNIDLSEFDTIVLGCTHYPLIENVFTDILSDRNITIFDPAEEVALKVHNHCLRKSSQNNDSPTNIKFLISKESEIFRNRVKNMFKDIEYDIKVI